MKESPLGFFTASPPPWGTSARSVSVSLRVKTFGTHWKFGASSVVSITCSGFVTAVETTASDGGLLVLAVDVEDDWVDDSAR